MYDSAWLVNKLSQRLCDQCPGNVFCCFGGIRILGYLGGDNGSFKYQRQLISENIRLFSIGLCTKISDIISHQTLKLLADISNRRVFFGIFADDIDEHTAEKCSRPTLKSTFRPMVDTVLTVLLLGKNSLQTLNCGESKTVSFI